MGEAFRFVRAMAQAAENEALVPLMLAARLLTDAELDVVDTNCAALGATWRLHFAVAGGAAHTPKVHLIERHVPFYARLHGTLGMLGEEAVEALHPWWTAAARLCQAMTNPKARRASLQGSGALRPNNGAKPLCAPRKTARAQRRAGLRAKRWAEPWWFLH